MSMPIVRIVRMTFHPERLPDFQRLFRERAPSIRSFPGCRQLNLLRDARFPNVMATISVWDSEEALASYRDSSLFRETWSLTKTMFADRPTARTYVQTQEVRPQTSSNTDFRAGN